MDPFSALASGIAVAGLAQKVIKKSTQVLDRFREAPAELDGLKRKVFLLQTLASQIEARRAKLPAEVGSGEALRDCPQEAEKAITDLLQVSQSYHGEASDLGTGTRLRWAFRGIQGVQKYERRFEDIRGTLDSIILTVIWSVQDEIQRKQDFSYSNIEALLSKHEPLLNPKPVQSCLDGADATRPDKPTSRALFQPITSSPRPKVDIKGHARIVPCVPEASCHSFDQYLASSPGSWEVVLYATYQEIFMMEIVYGTRVKTPTTYWQQRQQLRTVLISVFGTLLAAFYIVPVVILALRLVGPFWGECISLVWAKAVSVVLSIMVPDWIVRYVLIYTYAHLLFILTRT